MAWAVQVTTRTKTRAQNAIFEESRHRVQARRKGGYFLNKRKTPPEPPKRGATYQRPHAPQKPPGAKANGQSKSKTQNNMEKYNVNNANENCFQGGIPGQADEATEYYTEIVCVKVEQGKRTRIASVIKQAKSEGQARAEYLHMVQSAWERDKSTNTKYKQLD